MRTTLLSTIAIFLFATANAQTTEATANQNVTLILKDQIEITVVSGSDAGKNFTFESLDNYTSGLTNISASQFHVRSNRDWTVAVTSAAEFTSVNSITTMPSTVLGVRLTGKETFEPLGTSAITLTSGDRGSGEKNKFTVDYNAKPGFDYAPDTYTLALTYTATAK